MKHLLQFYKSSDFWLIEEFSRIGSDDFIVALKNILSFIKSNIPQNAYQACIIKNIKMQPNL